MRRAAAIALALLASGCTLLPTDEGGKATPYRGELADLRTWTATGRIHILKDGESWHATLYWRQARDTYRIRLIAPLGQGTMELKSEGGQVTLRTTEGDTFSASDPETLMQETLGWRVPVQGLRHWMVGRPAPDRPVEGRAVNERGRLAELRQAGWRIRYAGYDGKAGIALPRKLTLETGGLAVRVVVTRWEPGRA